MSSWPFEMYSGASLFLLFALLWGCPQEIVANSLAIDLGSDTMKIAVVLPRKPLEIVLDSESQRKSPAAIAFRDKERLFGRAAIALATRSPELVFQSIPMLLGKPLDHPTVKLYLQRYPYHNISYDPATGYLLLKHPNGLTFAVEELVAMLFEYARDLAESHSGEGIVLRSVVLTVPSFYGQAERRSLIRAAQLAGLDVIQLIADNTAVALNFGISRYSSFDASAQYYMFFDVGYTSTTATVVSYQTGKSANSESGPILSVLGVGFAPTLGTSTFIYLLRDHVARQFHAMYPNVKGDITQNVKSMAKLTVETTRLFTMLSANTEILLQVENVFEGQDLALKVTRNELESIAADAFDRFRQPFMDAIRNAKIDLSAIREIVLMGGGTRVPKIQSILMKLGNRSDLGKGVNNDEAAALGAVYQAAARTPGFKVLPFIVREYNPYPIAVFFEPAPAAKEEKAAATDSNSTHIHRVLFVRGNPYPQKRAITFNRHTNDLSFHISYVELDDHELDHLVTTNLSEVTTVGVSSALSRQQTSAELRGVKAHFTLDHSGLLVLTGIDCLFHPLADTSISPDQSTLQKLGTKLSDLFGGIGGGGGGDAAAAATESVNGTTAEPSVPASSDTSGSSNDTDNLGAGNLSATHKASEPVSLNTTTGLKDKKLTPFTERVSFQFVHLDSPTPTDDHASAAKEKLLALRQADQAKRDWENAMNELESCIFSTRDKLETESFVRHSTSDELSTLSKLVADHSLWFDEQGPSTSIEAFQEKHNELRRLLLPIESRISETENRPRAFLELNKEITEAAQFLQTVKQNMLLLQQMSDNLTATYGDQSNSSVNASEASTTAPPPPPPVWPSLFTDTEQTALETLLNDTKSWIEDSETKLATLTPVERPPVTVADIEEKQRQIRREVHYLNKKAVLWRKEVERLLARHAAEQAKRMSPPSSAEVPTEPPSTPTTDEESTTSTDQSTSNQSATTESVPPVPPIKTEL